MVTIADSPDGHKYRKEHVEPDHLAAWFKDYKVHNNRDQYSASKGKAALLTFSALLQDGKLKPYIKSQPIPETNDEPIKVVVRDTLQDMFFNSGKNGERVYHNVIFL